MTVAIRTPTDPHTSTKAMSFRHSLERKTNDHMQDDGQPGRAPPEIEDADMAMKKGLSSPGYPVDEKVYGKEQHPPRFSTIFGANPAPPPPPPPQRGYIPDYYPPPQRKSGVFLPMPLFIVFAVILFLESTILFAYTVIGLYNNAPARLFPWAGHGGAVATACNYGPQQPAVNIAPNFIIPQAGQPLPDLVTTTASVSTSTSSSSASSTSSFSTSSTTNSDAAAAASDIAGIFGGLTSVTASATRPTVTSVKLITEDPSGDVLTPRPTVTRTTFINPPSNTGTIADAAATISSNTNAQTSSSSYDAAAWASVSSALAAVSADLTPSPFGGITVTPTTLDPSVIPVPTA
ncbi:hypothetical protein DOTSEDRAFT_75199 [Dothistroma septosporum NZE10]|uniref:Uncharacterized protein n=1 Tax=Dothistroma septosporum (strain NZE10 / CBS 128990) TaxID=675120 RepID=M2YKE3_DOTSN|nr:hypothetical protein DOTSEDRAFT_75199 [Dothistroma septosporum NZE10]